MIVHRRGLSILNRIYKHNGLRTGLSPLAADGRYSLAALFSTGSVPPPGQVKPEDIRTLFNNWNEALATLDSSKVASMYAKDGLLLPTVSDTARTDFASIKDYFDHFLQNKPQGTIVDGHIRIDGNWAQDAGIYEFHLRASDTKVKARYSFLYAFQDGEWKIAHHHSSAMPEQMSPKGVVLTEKQVRDLFVSWNASLATLDPATVASHYSSRALLLPTVSDTSRTSNALIQDYFVHFLKNKPQAEIVESHVTTGENWFEDSGVYEFTFGSDGTKLKARYSFVYILEDGKWKILHHHSSMMPETTIIAKGSLSVEEARAKFKEWNKTLGTLDSTKVAQHYAKNAVLLPTVSNIPRTDFALIKDYFDHFLQNKPQAEIVESYVECGDGWFKDAGIYEFTMGKDGSKVKARYSFVYILEDGEWKILHHHSSAMPESNNPTITEEEVRAIFYDWNKTLGSLDSEAVAKRYAKNAVLLPTVSDTPRTTFALIKDYFDHFLLNKPQAVIVESQVEIGDAWFKDVGIYEFTMGIDGSKTKARYSYFYILEDGEWKISHHHSSAMPEALIAASNELAELKSK